MFVFKLEIRFAMIKIGHTLDGMKRYFCMALLAVLSEFILMGILMAVGAIGKLFPGKFLELQPILHGQGMTF